jgi:quercetin dioxygenase-like cupin family protein
VEFLHYNFLGRNYIVGLEFLRVGHNKSLEEIMKVAMLLIALVAVLTPISFAEEMKPMTHDVVAPESVEWGPCPPNLPAGCKIAVLQGDPSKDGQEFTMRAWWPDGYKIMPHYHPMTENLTVISGTFNVGMGDKFDANTTKKMPPGSFISMPPQMHHYAWAEGETVIQLNALGPFATIYVNPADDPSMKK